MKCGRECLLWSWPPGVMNPVCTILDAVRQEGDSCICDDERRARLYDQLELTPEQRERIENERA